MWYWTKAENGLDSGGERIIFFVRTRAPYSQIDRQTDSIEMD